MNASDISIAFEPLLPWWAIAALGGPVIGGVLAFLALGEYFGLLPATFAIVFICALGDRSNTIWQALLLSAAMMVVAVVIFWWALQVQMPLVKWGA